MNNTTDWLKNYFIEEKGAPKEIETEVNYFDAGYMDSFGIISLISVIEKVFCIQFSQEALQDRRISTIKGMAKIIDELACNEVI